MRSNGLLGWANGSGTHSADVPKAAQTCSLCGEEEVIPGICPFWGFCSSRGRPDLPTNSGPSTQGTTERKENDGL